MPQAILDKFTQQQKDNDKKVLTAKVISDHKSLILPMIDTFNKEYGNYQKNVDYWSNGIKEDLKNVFDEKMNTFTQLEELLENINKEFQLLFPSDNDVV